MPPEAEAGDGAAPPEANEDATAPQESAVDADVPPEAADAAAAPPEAAQDDAAPPKADIPLPRSHRRRKRKVSSVPHGLEASRSSLSARRPF